MDRSILLALVFVVVPQLAHAQTPNLALGQPASLSSTWKVGSTADKAVDGDANLDFYHGSCARSACSDHDPSWTVCLGGTYEVTSVTIANPKQAYGRLHSITIEVFEQNPNLGVGTFHVCVSTPSSPPLADNMVHTFNCPAATRGKYVRIKKSPSSSGYGCANALILCEVEVFGTPYIECGDGFVSNGGSCYHVDVNDLDSWFEAREACKAIGADLVIITSSGENTYVHGLLGGAGRYWIGATNFLLGGDQYQWLDFTPIPLNGGEFEDWDETINEPDFTTTMKCVSTLFDSGDFDWRTWQCSNNLPYVCEKSPTWPKPCDQGC